MTSHDGITWTDNPNAGGVLMTSVTYGDGLFVAMGYGVAYTSPDGITWTTRNFPAADRLIGPYKCITYANGLFVGVTGSNLINASQDVITSGTLGVLAVHWLNINGTLTSTNNAQLSWKVAEQFVKNYAIEKSNDGSHYNPIATIASKGTGENGYTFTETAKLNSHAWYRIKQTDIDGKINYSGTVYINAKTLTKIKVYPNPSSDAVTLTVSNSLLNKTAILTNMNGKILQALRITTRSFTINVTGYSAGIYSLKVENEPPVKIIKQ